ncbi:RagB/SusD family nutrient uptake outer membrane protein [Mucilaginibacter rubeus]|uniref:RagB/SusD family nutrient uptake outer membrane protein n=1 Tax=Mucilaginibacter rubeus TaxID=2027860 RepID=A0A5C1I0Q3_9SPHI|nr:RagB/SusD family nutrient uptake outer membrane protein [Mucilaginibacter rubeus]QEM11757.1 RagB/SusD family nutrient uptake outer membrane protein [Mucilaginibacter rubeus]
MTVKYTRLFISVFCCCFLACKKELDVYPTTSEVDGNVIIDTKSAATVLNGVYYRFANAGADYNNIPSVKWIDVSESFPSELAGSLKNSGGDDQIYSLSYNAATPGIDRVWNYAYLLVNAANGFIKNITPVSSIPAAVKTEMLAEAKFLRAFGDTELLLYYGEYNNPNSKYGIMLRDEFVNSANINLPRSTVAASYAAILADLDAAISGLPSQNTQNVYACAAAAKLLKARLLINRGGQDDYAQVISLADDVISNGPFDLENNTKDIFLLKGFSSKEVILAIQPFTNENYKFNTNQYYGQFPVSTTFVDLLNNDPRSQWVYKDDQKGTIYGYYYGNINEITKYYSGPVNPAVKTSLSENGYAFRLSEAYLLEAEALTLSGGSLSQAKILLKTVQGRAGVTDFTAVDNTAAAAELQLLVVKEEIKSFFAENGADWFALRRLPLTAAQTIQPSLKTVAQFILPVPQSEIIANNQMIQNPGY